MIQIELLWALQCIDREIYSLKKDISNKEVYNRLNLIKSEYDNLKGTYDKEIFALEENNKTAKRLNAELKNLDQKVKDDTKRMYDEGNSIKIIDSLQKEVDDCKLRIDEVENELLRIIEANENLNKDVGDKKRRLSEIKKEFDLLKGKYIGKNEDNKQKIEELSQRRKKLIGEIDEELVKQYNDIAGKKNNAMTQVIDGTCMECGVRLNAILYDTLKKRNQLCKCDNCGRILYLE